MKFIRNFSSICMFSLTTILLIACANAGPGAYTNSLIGTWALDASSLHAGHAATSVTSVITFGPDGSYQSTSQYEDKPPENLKGVYQIQQGGVLINIDGQQTQFKYQVQGTKLMLSDPSQQSAVVTYIKQ